MTANLERYELQRRAEMLRREIFADLARPDLEEWLRELNTLEGSLRQEPPPPAAGGNPQKGVLIDNSAGRSEDDYLLGPDTTQVTVKALLRMTHVPTGFVHLLKAEDEPLVTFELKVEPTREFARLRVTSYVEGYSARAVDTVEVMGDKSATVTQLPTFFPECLQQVREQTRATLHIEVDDLGGGGTSTAPRTELHRSFPIWLLPPTTAWLGVKDPITGKNVDLSRYFAAWVTPNAPEVLRLLRKAAELVTPSKGIFGYNQNSEDIVTVQVSAIFEALKQEGLTYVNTVFASGGSSDRFQQRVRLPRESLVSKSANCIDGTVLFASLLEAASLFAGLVIIPGHAFVAWKRSKDPAKDDWSFLETTMIGTSDFQRSCAVATELAKSAHKQLLQIPTLRTEGIVPME
jgi:hypothetical protein